MAMFTFCVLTVAISGHWPCILGGLAAETIRCPAGDIQCEKDRVGYEAIQNLHNQIDDDRDGSLDRFESDEYIRDELKYEDGLERHVNFHNADDLITVTDLWGLWIQSDVYNWTVDDVIEWVSVTLELPQYAESLRVNAVDGHTLPRIASNGQYLTSILGIKNPVHKQKLSLKAKDIVLFGPTKTHNYVKDLALVLSLVVAVGGCWLAYVQHQYAQLHLSKVMRDLDTLQKSEDALLELQDKLEQAQQKQRSVVMEKESLEEKMKREINQAMSEAERLKTTRDSTEEEIERLKLAEEELVQVRLALQQAERELESRQHAPLGELQQWLQLTYELESLHYDAKREAAVKQLRAAKDMCERIHKKRNAFLGSLRVAHTTSMDDTDHSIMATRSALEEVKVELSERSSRWKQIEKICGFNIILNPGLQYLESLLRTGFIHSGGLIHDLAQPINLDEADEDLPPGAGTQAGMRKSSSSNSIQRQQSSSSLHSPSMLYPNRNGWVKVNMASSMSPMVPATGLAGLVQASMQLSMVGAGGDPRRKGAGSVFHAGPPEVRMPRNTSLARAFGSTASLGRVSGGVAGSSTAQLVSTNSRVYQPSIVSTQTSPSTTSAVAATASDVSHVDEHSSPSNGSVQFHLGGITSGSTLQLDDSFEAVETLPNLPQPITYAKSTSLETPNPQRPSTLPTSLSSPAPTTDATRRPNAPGTSATAGAGARTGTRMGTAGGNDSSSPESTDTNSLNGGVTSSGDVKKKKKRKLFGKLMKGSSDKQKST